MPIQINSSYTLNTNISQTSVQNIVLFLKTQKAFLWQKFEENLFFGIKQYFNPKLIFPVILNKNQYMKILIFVHQMGNISFIHKQKQSCGAVMTKVHFRFPINSDNG